MPKLHEVLAAEKTRMAAWNAVMEETRKKFADRHYFEGHVKTLRMIEESEGNKAIEDQARESKPVITTVYETLEYLLDLYSTAEDLQYDKNDTNRHAVGTVMWEGQPLFTDLPVDELLGLENRLGKLRELFLVIPTVDASRQWQRSSSSGTHGWVALPPEDTTKTEKQVIPVVLHEGTKEHPPQVQAIHKDVVVGRFTTVRYSGSATALQKAEGIKRIDALLVEVKQARMRANETEVHHRNLAETLVRLLLEPFLLSL